MKKILLISAIMIASGCIANAEPVMDFSVGAAPFQMLQKNQFEKESAEHWQNVKRSNDEYAQERYDDMNSAEIERLKQKPQIKLNSNKSPQMVEQNGVVKIEYR